MKPWLVHSIKIVFPVSECNQRKKFGGFGAFKVPKETHEVLKWIFDRAPWITDVIKRQIDGQLLDVGNKGQFTVDWHLGGDLKTIKCMLGCAQEYTFSNFGKNSKVWHKSNFV